MKNAAMIRDKIVCFLKNEADLNGLVAADINGCICSAADIALSEADGSCEVYRIAVVPYNWQKAIS